MKKWDEYKYRQQISEAKRALNRAHDLLELLDPEDLSAPAVWTAVGAAVDVAQLRLHDAREAVPEGFPVTKGAAG